MSSKRRRRRQLEKKRQDQGSVESTTLLTQPMQQHRVSTIADLVLHRGLGNLRGGVAPRTSFHQPAPPPVVAPVEKPPIQVVQPTAAPLSSVDIDRAVEISQRQRVIIWRQADDNAAHYLLLAEQAKWKTPWFRFPRHDYQYSEFVMMTPEMASVMLEHLWKREDGNRNEKPKLKAAYRRDIENGNWIPSDEGIGINLSGEVYNGQHRLEAIVESKKSWPMYVTWNVLDEAKFVCDSGAKRNISEKFRVIGVNVLGMRTAGVCKAMMRGLSGKDRYSESEVAEFATKWADVLEWLKDNFTPTKDGKKLNRMSRVRVEVLACVAKAYLWYGDEVMAPFCFRLTNIKFPEDGDPAKALYSWLNNDRINHNAEAMSVYKKTLGAIEGLVDGRKIERLWGSDVDIFDWTPGWNLPEKEIASA